MEAGIGAGYVRLVLTAFKHPFHPDRLIQIRRNAMGQNTEMSPVVSMLFIPKSLVIFDIAAEVASYNCTGVYIVAKVQAKYCVR